MLWEKKMRKFMPGVLRQTYMAEVEGLTHRVIEAGELKSETVNGQTLVHWILQFDTLKGGQFKLIEPNYQQKVQVLRDLGKWKKIALEVMPPEREVVDRADVYHLWEFPELEDFRFNIAPIFEKPTGFEMEKEGIKYHIRREGRVKYIYLNNAGLGWKIKQNLKNQITTPINTAVEVICEEMSEKDYACLIVLPVSEKLDFGLV